MGDSQPLKKIVSRRRVPGHFGCNFGDSSTVMELECGHTKAVKTSQAPRFRARCRECWTDADPS